MAQLIESGRLVLPDGERQADILIEDERIAAIGENLTAPDGCQRHDASGCLVFPGFIDPHTHFDMQATETVTADDFPSGTAAALAGGTTCIIDFATQERGATLLDAIERWREKAGGRSSCDYGFHMAITDWSAATEQELATMLAIGVTSYKLYMAYDDLRVRDAAIFEVLRAAGAQGGLLAVHCENGDLINELVAQHRAQGDIAPRFHALCHPAVVEAEAVERFLAIAELAGLPVLVPHLSTARGLEAVRRARARGQKVYVETCPQYLLLDESRYELPGFEGAKYVCSPPLRARADVDALWQALEAGEIDTVATDHCSFTFAEQKELGKDDFSRIPNGLPGVEHRAALLYTAGIAAGRITAATMAKLLAENPARLYGMFPQKGAIAVGSDADLVVWDPAKKDVLRAANQVQAVDYTPYEGFETVGGPRLVFLRGRPAAQEGHLLGEGLGRYVQRGLAEFF